MVVLYLQEDLHVFPPLVPTARPEDRCCVMTWGCVYRVLCDGLPKLCSQKVLTLGFKPRSPTGTLLFPFYCTASSEVHFHFVYLAYKYLLSITWVPGTGLSTTDTDLSRPRTFPLCFPQNAPSPLLMSWWKYVFVILWNLDFCTMHITYVLPFIIT